MPSTSVKEQQCDINTKLFSSTKASATTTTTDTTKSCTTDKKNNDNENSLLPLYLPLGIAGGTIEFYTSWYRLKQLEKWKELAIRPKSILDCHPNDRDMYNNIHDNLIELTNRCLMVRKQMNQSLPPIQIIQPYDDYLVPQQSCIPNAGIGLFYKPPSGITKTKINTTTNLNLNNSDQKVIDSFHSQLIIDETILSQTPLSPPSCTTTANAVTSTVVESTEETQSDWSIPPNTTIAYYCGHFHTTQSLRQLVTDFSYVMLCPNTTSSSATLWVDPGPLHHIKARYINH